jgi:hypothetical protein
MFTKVPVHYEEIGKKIQIKTSEKVEILLDRHLIDQDKIGTNKKRAIFLPKDKLTFLLALAGVNSYKLLGIDVCFGLIWFEIINIGGHQYKNVTFQQDFFNQKMINLPEVFAIELANLEMIKSAFDRLNKKHGYTTLTELANAKPSRKEKLIQAWQESGTQILKTLCDFNQSEKFNKKTRHEFLMDVTRIGLYTPGTNA